jgi:hypothetical protein
MGWSMVSCVGFNLIVNLGFILISTAKDSYYKLRKKYYQTKLKSLKKRKAARRAELLVQIADECQLDLIEEEGPQVYPKKRVTFLID